MFPEQRKAMFETLRKNVYNRGNVSGQNYVNENIKSAYIDQKPTPKQIEARARNFNRRIAQAKMIKNKQIVEHNKLNQFNRDKGIVKKELIKNFAENVETKLTLQSLSKVFLKVVHFFTFMRFIQDTIRTQKKQIADFYIAMIIQKTLIDKMKKQVYFDNKTNLKQRNQIRVSQSFQILATILKQRVETRSLNIVGGFMKDIKQIIKLNLCCINKIRILKGAAKRMKRFRKAIKN